MAFTANVEVALLPESTSPSDITKARVQQFISSSPNAIYQEGGIDFTSEPYLALHCFSIDTSSDNVKSKSVAVKDIKFSIFVFHLHDEGVAEETVDEEDEASVAACSQWALPCREFHGLWDSLVYDSSVKPRLLNYARTALLYSDAGVDSNLITWNRVVLLHGPPGTGKTSLCKALAHKTAIRLSTRFPSAVLVEVNAHSLFSKWFSESGKLVQRLFSKITDLVDDPDTFVMVMIDEVESLTAARQSGGNANEPGDAMRVVNALLTQVDRLRLYPNVLIMTTSNITGAIDAAFVDRADLKVFIGPPSAPGCYRILRSCIDDLSRCGIVSECNFLDVESAEALHNNQTFSSLLPSLSASRLDIDAAVHGEAVPFVTTAEPTSSLVSSCLYEIASKSQGLSGRALRKIPFIAHSLRHMTGDVPILSFLDSLALALRSELISREELVA